MDGVIAAAGRIAEEFARLFLDLAPYLLVGLAAAGLLTTFVRRSVLRRALGGKGLAPVLKASLLGVPLPLCSCSVVPMAVSLRRQGASRGSTLSFLVSTPETGVDSIAVTYALMGPLMTVVRPLAAVATAFAAGAVQVFCDRKEPAPEAPETEECAVCDADESDGHRHGALERLGHAARYAFRDFFGDIVGWVLLGLAVAAAISAFVSPEWVRLNFSSSGLQILAMLAVSVPLYVCASATTPVAASLVAAGFSPGAALVLLLAGPATNVATILMVWRFLGGKSAAIYVLVIAVVSAALGLLLDATLGAFVADPGSVVKAPGEGPAGPVAIASGALLAALAAVHYGRAAVGRLGRRRKKGGAACACGTDAAEPPRGRERSADSVDTADVGS